MKTTSFKRFRDIGFVFTIVAVAILVQTLRLQFSPEARLVRDTVKANHEQIKLRSQPERGYIYDRWGRLLAGNREVFDLEVDFSVMYYPDRIAAAVSSTLGLDYVQVYNKLMVESGRSDPKTNQPYPVKQPALRQSTNIAHGVDPDRIKILDELEKNYIEEGLNYLSGIVWFPRLIRTYPENNLAGTVLGFVTFKDPELPIGFFGIEGHFNEYLTGSSNSVVYESDPIKVNPIASIPSGASLILTIDRELQATVERILEKSLKANGAASGTIVVMDPKTGEILAMTSSPTFNPNEYYKDTTRLQSEVPFNRAIGQVYEPGSVFKVLIMAAALDSGTVTPQTKFIDKGVFNYAGISVVNWNRAAWGEQTMTGCLKNSLNVCLAWISTTMGSKTLYDYLDRFGIGEYTYIDLDGEISYPLTLPGDPGWHNSNLATNAYGHSVAVTPIQMLKAASAIANNGQMVSPHVLKAYVDNGRQYDITPSLEAPVIKPETAKTLSNMLAEAIEGEASTSAVPGYRIAGKTGTADIAINGSYSSGLTNASFIGWGPVDDPKFMVYVWFEKPRSNIYGSIVAAPVFKEVFQTAVTLYNIPPDQARKQLYGQ